jgi:hypothetical protein
VDVVRAKRAGDRAEARASQEIAEIRRAVGFQQLQISYWTESHVNYDSIRVFLRRIGALKFSDSIRAGSYPDSDLASVPVPEWVAKSISPGILFFPKSTRWRDRCAERVRYDTASLVVRREDAGHTAEFFPWRSTVEFRHSNPRANDWTTDGRINALSDLAAACMAVVIPNVPFAGPGPLGRTGPSPWQWWGDARALILDGLDSMRLWLVVNGKMTFPITVRRVHQVQRSGSLAAAFWYQFPDSLVASAELPYTP